MTYGEARSRIMAQPCRCGAQPGGRCLPLLLSGGFHRERLEAAGIPIQIPTTRKYQRAPERTGREVPFR